MSVYAYYEKVERKMLKSDLSSQCNGERTVFILPQIYEGGSVRVYWNGVRQIAGTTFSESGTNQISLDFVPQTGDYLTVDYRPI